MNFEEAKRLMKAYRRNHPGHCFCEALIEDLERTYEDGDV